MARPWRVARSLEVLRGQIDALAPARSKVSDGGIGDALHASRASDHNPWVLLGGVGIVTARDFTHDPARGADMHALAPLVVQDPRVKYVIWNRRIANRGGPWRPYTGANPHTRHMHVSVEPTAALFDSTTAWRLTVARPAPPEDILASIDDLRRVIREEVGRAVWHAYPIAPRDMNNKLLPAANAEVLLARNEALHERVEKLRAEVAELRAAIKS